MKAAVAHTKWVARSLTRSALQHQQQRQWQAETEAERAFLFTSRTSSAAKSGNPKRAKAFNSLSLALSVNCQLCVGVARSRSLLSLSLSLCISVWQTAVCTPCPNLLTLLRPPPLESSRLPQCNERDSCGCLHVILADIVNMTKMHVPLKRCVCQCVCMSECASSSVWLGVKPHLTCQCHIHLHI